MITVIDYGMGNLHSVRKALEIIGAKVKVSARAGDIEGAEKIVFPGVGSFGEAMRELKRRGLIKPLKNAIAEGKPFLGLCLGMQLLFDKSEEAPGVEGLCVLRGDVRRFKFTQYAIRNTQYSLKVPHMGWNTIIRNTQYTIRNTQILKGVPSGSHMYFVHSYYVRPKDESVILTTTDYGIDFTSGARKDNIYGFQFHPEKSQSLGLRILKNFAALK
jgi:imidazole glycerol-phosphate synthase subunit HisH